MVTDIKTQELRIVAANEETILNVDFDAFQGLWTREQYLRLTDSTNKLVEFTDGALEVLPMPTDHHQSILQFLLLALHAFIHPRGGIVRFSPLRLQIYEDKFREPDLLLILDANDPRRQNTYWLGADLVTEVVSPDNPERDTVVKRTEYAEVGIPEYWIVSPIDESVTVLRLAGEEYEEHGIFRRGDTASSVLLEGFAVDVNAVFDAR